MNKGYLFAALTPVAAVISLPVIDHQADRCRTSLENVLQKNEFLQSRGHWDTWPYPLGDVFHLVVSESIYKQLEELKGHGFCLRVETLPAGDKVELGLDDLEISDETLDSLTSEM